MSSLVLVDVGYLIAALSTRATGAPERGRVDVDLPAMIDLVRTVAAEHGDQSVLRVMWYDGAPHRSASPNPCQEAVGALPGVKLRLGRTSYNGGQKGVDIKIALDLVAAAATGRYSGYYLLSGDDDLTEPVEIAQMAGASVSVISVPDAEGRALGLANNLRLAADEVLLLPEVALDLVTALVPFAALGGINEDVQVDPTATPVGEIASPDEARVTPMALAGRFQPRLAAVHQPPERAPWSASALEAGELAAMDDVVAAFLEPIAAQAPRLTGLRERAQAARPHLPPDVDRRLLLDLAAHIDDEQVSQKMREGLRAQFWVHLDRAWAGLQSAVSA